MLAAGGLFFVVLTVVMVLRPVREALGLERGIENVRRLFLLTLVSTLLLAPLFGWLAARVRRAKLISVSFRICALILLGFFLVLTLLPETMHGAVASVYYIYHSVFNLFVVSLFWAFMADHFSLADSKRLFPAIAVGGTLGAIFGSWVALKLAGSAGVTGLFLLAAVFLELAVWMAAYVGRSRTVPVGEIGEERPLGGHAFAGIEAVVRSPYILGIAGFVILVGLCSTLLYFTGLRLVEGASKSLEHRTALFANINIWTQVFTLVAQAFLTARIIRAAGVWAALAVMPILAALGFAALAMAPTLAAFTLINAVFRAAQQGITRPARETLFTVLDPEAKYKAKSFLDTFGYRAGDVTGAQVERLLANVGVGLAPMAAMVIALATVWLGLCRYLDRTQAKFNHHAPS